MKQNYVAIKKDVLVSMSKVDDVKRVRENGILKIEMHFLPDVYVPCEICMVVVIIQKHWK